MIEVTYTTYVEILKKSYINTKVVKTMEDFNLFALSLNLHITKIETKTIRA